MSSFWGICTQIVAVIAAARLGNQILFIASGLFQHIKIMINRESGLVQDSVQEMQWVLAEGNMIYTVIDSTSGEARGTRTSWEFGKWAGPRPADFIFLCAFFCFLTKPRLRSKFGIIVCCYPEVHQRCLHLFPFHTAGWGLEVKKQLLAVSWPRSVQGWSLAVTEHQLNAN